MMPTIITRTIDAGGGGDFTTFTAAEAAVLTLVTTDDMVFHDEAIVFECVAGTYNESVTIDSSTPGPALTTDATRNVTYKAAAGSEHGGDFTAGVRITSASITLTVREPFARIEGLVVESTANYAFNADRGGVTLDACIGKAPTACFLLGQFTGSPPLLATNCVAICDSSYGFWCNVSGDIEVDNCTALQTNGGTAYRFNDSGGQLSVALTNNVALSSSLSAYVAFGTPTITGSNNVGGATDPFPVGLQASSQTWTFSTNPADTSTGSQVIYDATSGALLNVPGNDAVGVCGVTGIPATDINGEDRIRDTHADPGAFVAPLRTITKSIDGGGGGDYTTFLAAEGAVTTWPTELDMVKRNEAIVFEATAGEYDTFSVGSTLTQDATRNVTYRAASGSEHNGVPGTGVIVYNDIGSRTVIISDDFTAFEDLTAETRTGTSGKDCWYGTGAQGLTFRRCIARDISSSANNTGFAILATGLTDPAAVTFENCLTVDTVAAFEHEGGTNPVLRLRNCTVIGGTRGCYQLSATNPTIDAINVLLLGTTSAVQGSVTLTGSGNVGGANNPFPVAQQALSQTWTFSTDDQAASTGSQVIYDATSGAMLNVPGNDAVGVGTSTGAPATDILGKERLRGAYADPGAFTTDLVTIGRTIDGGGGGDYTTFTAAEAAVGALPTAADLVQRNEAIVFEAVAGDYSESGANVSFTSSLVSDATRNVTWTYAAGSNHGGDPASGVRCTWLGPLINDSFVTFDGLVFSVTDPNGVQPRGDEGIVLRNLVIDQSAGSLGISATGNVGSPAAPLVIENCRVLAVGGAIRVRRTAAVTADGSARIANNTVSTTGSTTVGIYPFNTSTGTLEAQVVNNIVLVADSTFVSSGTVALSGAGNVGGSTNPFPVALQASSQTWTFSTNPADASTGFLAIYDATNGALLNVPGNDAVGVGTSTGAPATDILGKDRLRGVYADPGAFTTDLVTIGRTIDGAGGGDYTTFTAAEAAIGALVTDTNLTQRNEAVTFDAEAGTYPEAVPVQFASTSGSCTRENCVTFRAAPGSGHGGDATSGVILDSIEARSLSDYLTVDGLVVGIADGSNSGAGFPFGLTMRNSIILGSYTARIGPDNGLDNCVFPSTAAGSDNFVIWAAVGGTDLAIRNCTFYGNEARNGSYQGSSGYASLSLVNNLFVDGGGHLRDFSGGLPLNVTGSGNLASSVGAHDIPASVKRDGISWTFTTDDQAASTGSQVIYDATNGAMVDAPGNDAWQILTDLSVAPATDIEGVTREATGYNPGAFERTAADVGTPMDGGVDYLRALNIRDRFLRGAAIREPFLRNLRG